MFARAVEIAPSFIPLRPKLKVRVRETKMPKRGVYMYCEAELPGARSSAPTVVRR
jgi:hypothetical protein